MKRGLAILSKQSRSFTIKRIDKLIADINKNSDLSGPAWNDLFNWLDGATYSVISWREKKNQ